MLIDPTKVKLSDPQVNDLRALADQYALYVSAELQQRLIGSQRINTTLPGSYPNKITAVKRLQKLSSDEFGRLVKYNGNLGLFIITEAGFKWLNRDMPKIIELPAHKFKRGDLVASFSGRVYGVTDLQFTLSGWLYVLKDMRGQHTAIETDLSAFIEDDSL